MSDITYFAALDLHDNVTRVVCLSEDALIGPNGEKSEENGRQYLSGILGLDPSKIIQTSPSGEFRFRLAGIGMYYDRNRDAFITPNPHHPSWTLCEETMCWVPPVPHPDSDGEFSWDEEGQRWVPVGMPNNGNTLFRL